MPYIAYELAALEEAPNVARAARVPENDIIAGHVRMWKHCWNKKVDQVDAILVQGFFGSDVSQALVAFKYLEPIAGGFRVRGASRYLRISKAQSEGGKKNVLNLRRGSTPESRKSPPGTVPGNPGVEPERTPGSSPGLTPSTEHRAPSTEYKEEEKHPVGKLLDDISAAFKSQRGAEFGWSFGEEDALRGLLGLAKGDEEIILAYWERALRRTVFPLCSSLPELKRHWNHYAADEPRKADPVAERMKSAGKRGPTAQDPCVNCGDDASCAIGGKRFCSICARNEQELRQFRKAGEVQHAG